MRARIIIFIVVLMVLATLDGLKVIGAPVPLVIAAATYLVVVLPAIPRERR